MDGSRERAKITAGLDLGDKYSYLCPIDTESGEVMEEGRLRTTPETLKRRFASERPPMRIAVEAGTHSPWASRVLEECGHEVLVANARKLRLIYANKRKTDEVDAENLARLARVNPKLLYPLKHRGEQSQGPVRGQGSPEAYLQGRRRDAEEALGGQCPLRTGPLRFGLGPQAPRREDSRQGSQERKETGGCGRGEEALSALAPPVGNGRGLRPSLRRP